MKSPLCYVGGKSQLAPKIVSAIPAHKTYVEVFAGAAGTIGSRANTTKRV